MRNIPGTATALILALSAPAFALDDYEKALIAEGKLVISKPAEIYQPKTGGIYFDSAFEDELFYHPDSIDQFEGGLIVPITNNKPLAQIAMKLWFSCDGRMSLVLIDASALGMIERRETPLEHIVATARRIDDGEDDELLALSEKLCSEHN